MGLPDALAAVANALDKVPLSELVPKNQQVVSLEHNTTVGQALSILAKKHILSAPLVVFPGLEDSGCTDGEDPQPQLIGWVTVESILKAFLSHMEETHGKLPRSMLQLMSRLEKEGPAFADRPLITVAGGEDRGLMFQVNADVSLITALRESFCPVGKPSAHRLAVFDATGAIVAVVSQLDVLRYLRQRTELLGELAGTSVEALGLGVGHAVPSAPSPTPSPGGPPPSPGARTPSGLLASVGGGRLVAVEASLPTLLAFERMARCGVSGAPVVADTDAAVGSSGGGGSGAMIANLSMSDLRNIQSQHFGILALPAGEFLALLHNTSYLGYSQRNNPQAGHPFFASGPTSAPPPPSSPGVGASPSFPRRMSSSSPRTSGSFSVPLGRGSVGGPGAGGGGGGGGEGEEGNGLGGQEDGVRMITCTAASTLAEVISLLADNKVHRVYVVRQQPARAPPQQQAEGGGGGGHGHHVPTVLIPVGVITPTDILRLLLSGAN